IENIAAMQGALAGLIIGGIGAIARRRRLPAEEKIQISLKDTLLHMLPYAIRIAISFTVNNATFLDRNLNQSVLGVPVPELTRADGTVIPASRTQAISIFGHSGAQLAYAGLISLLLAHWRGSLPPGSNSAIRRGVVRSGVKSTLGILAMMAMATTMQL